MFGKDVKHCKRVVEKEDVEKGPDGKQGTQYNQYWLL